ncbi:hypothetical protein Tco_0071385 [Tanacetum coccineum]
MVPITQQEKVFDSGFYWPTITRMPLNLSTIVTFVNVQGKITATGCAAQKLHPGLPKSLTSGALSYWGPFPSSRREQDFPDCDGTLELAVFHKSFTSSASFWESRRVEPC